MRGWLPFALAVVSTVPLVAPPCAAQEIAPGYRVETRALSNGLRVIVSPQDDTARVAVFVQYAAGMRDDPADRHGLAHFTEHMMFQRTRHVGEDEFARMLERVGATNVNAETTRDATDYYEVLPAEQLPLALWLESERMAFLLDGVTPEGVVSQRRVVVDENMLRAARLGGVSIPAQRRALYPVGHPYHDAGDDLDDVMALTAPDVAWFFEQFYAPHNATLIIAGDVDVADTFARVEHDFGRLRDRPTAPRAPVTTRATPAVASTVRILAPVARERVRLTWRTPPDLAPGDADLDVLAAMLAGDDHASLRRTLVLSGVAESVEAWELGGALGSEFTITIELASGHRANEAIEETFARLALIQAGSIDAEAFAEWRGRYVDQVYAAQDNVLSRASALARYASRLSNVAGGFAFDANRYAAVTAESLRHAARRLRHESCVTEIIERREGAPRAGRIARRHGPGRAL